MVYGIITYSLFGKTYMLNMYKQVTFIKIDINSVFLFNLMNIANECCFFPAEIKWVNWIIVANDIFSV